MRSIIKNISKLISISEEPSTFLRGKALSHLNTMEDAFLSISDGNISGYGPMSECPEIADSFIDAGGGIVMPTWVDSHTHIVYPESREIEFIDKIRGLTYEEIAKRGGGILNSAKKMKFADESFLYESAMQRLYEMISLGTGAVEIKSGYGLDFDNEIKMLRVIKKIKESAPIPVKSTFLGAHAIPLEYKNDKSSYLDIICNEMLLYISENNLAEYVDVFCDKGFYSVEDTQRILETSAKFGLKPKIHANELAISGGVQVGVKNYAISVDHLECIGDEEIECLRNSNTIPTILPGTSFFLKIPFAPARKMIDSGLGLAIASDFNPGSSPSGNMNFIMSLSCIYLGLLPEEALNAMTNNASFALELQEKMGTITKGKIANLIITKPVRSLAQLPYYYGSNQINKVLINGKIF